MQSPAVVHRLASLGADVRGQVAGRLRDTWEWSDERCGRVEDLALDAYSSYEDLWRRGWRWWAPALLLVPVVCLAVVVLCVVLLAARLLTAAVVAATYLVLAAVAAAPVLAVAWALSSILTRRSRRRAGGSA